MFERRLKFVLAVMALITLVLVGRGFHVQVIQHEHWVKEATETLHHETYVETTRGQLLDRKGRPLAVDSAEVDACVDFRAITREPDAKWVAEIAKKRAAAREDYAHPKGTTKKAIVEEETLHVQSDIEKMWQALATAGKYTPDEMDDIRATIVARVQVRHDLAWKRKSDALEAARKQATSEPTTEPDALDEASNEEPWYRKWLDTDFDPTPTLAPSDVKVSEETEPHIILHAITPEVYNELGKQLEHFPGLVLRPGMGRLFPEKELAAHVIGRLTHVNATDLDNDPNKNDPLLKYQANDLIGRGGLESLCEPLLRGKRGRIEHWTASPNVDDATDDKTPKEQVEDPVPGQDVHTTIDIELQRAIQKTFTHVSPYLPAHPEIFANMHGSAVVIDVPTGEVRAMVSAPTYDLNQFDEQFSKLRSDDFNQPLLNRATQSVFETGSTIKPVVGIGAITQGVMGVRDTIKCTGYLIINGHRFETAFRCWTASKYKWPGHVLQDPPLSDLTFADALERSCNVYFENMGDRLGLDGLSRWMRTFGLGRITGIGIPERPGRLPDSIPTNSPRDELLRAKWYGGIGQDYVGATPLQMANVAATIARNGIWMRPRLVDDSTGQKLRDFEKAHPTTLPSASWTDVPDREDLHLSPEAVLAAQEGMFRVVNSKVGSGTILLRDDLQIAGKTGTAQAAPFRIPAYDADGKRIYENGRLKLEAVTPSTVDHPNPSAPWYLAFEDRDANNQPRDELKHSWYIGFAPAHDPKIAFCVMVEYGGSGGGAAGGIAKQVIQACIDQGYLPVEHPVAKVDTN